MDNRDSVFSNSSYFDPDQHPVLEQSNWKVSREPRFRNPSSQFQPGEQLPPLVLAGQPASPRFLADSPHQYVNVQQSPVTPYADDQLRLQYSAAISPLQIAVQGAPKGVFTPQPVSPEEQIQQNSMPNYVNDSVLASAQQQLAYSPRQAQHQNINPENLPPAPSVAKKPEDRSFLEKLGVFKSKPKGKSSPNFRGSENDIMDERQIDFRLADTSQVQFMENREKSPERASQPTLVRPPPLPQDTVPQPIFVPPRQVTPPPERRQTPPPQLQRTPSPRRRYTPPPQRRQAPPNEQPVYRTSLKKANTILVPDEIHESPPIRPIQVKRDDPRHSSRGRTRYPTRGRHSDRRYQQQQAPVTYQPRPQNQPQTAAHLRGPVNYIRYPEKSPDRRSQSPYGLDYTPRNPSVLSPNFRPPRPRGTHRLDDGARTEHLRAAALTASVFGIFFCFILGIPACVLSCQRPPKGNRNKYLIALGLASLAIILGIIWIIVVSIYAPSPGPSCERDFYTGRCVYD